MGAPEEDELLLDELELELEDELLELDEELLLELDELLDEELLEEELLEEPVSPPEEPLPPQAEIAADNSVTAPSCSPRVANMLNSRFAIIILSQSMKLFM